MDTLKTYTFSDLEKWDFSGTALAVVGQPIEHSLSPAMHNAWIRSLSAKDPSFANWAYFRFEIPPELLSEALNYFHKQGFLGINLTVPHKVMALDCVCDCSETARRMGAINTLKWMPQGYRGYNTDGYGLEMGIQKAFGKAFEGANVLISGAGGAARAAVVQALQKGAQSIYIRNRSKERLNAMVDNLKDLKGFDRIQCLAVEDIEDSLDALPLEGIYINATSLGLKSGDVLPFDVTALPPKWVVYDMIYNPKQTDLTRLALEQNRQQATGLGMLVHQGARAFELWSEHSVDAGIMEAAAEHALDTNY